MATTTVSRVRLRSTICVPPCDAGVKPMPPRPASRPECSKISAHSAIESRTWSTASAETIARARVSAGCDLQDYVDELRGDAFLRHLAGRAGLASAVDVEP